MEFVKDVVDDPARQCVAALTHATVSIPIKSPLNTTHMRLMYLISP